MNLERLRALKLAHPFQPFFLRLHDGRNFLIERSRDFAIAPDGSRLGVAANIGVAVLRLENIKDVEVVTTVAHGS